MINKLIIIWLLIFISQITYAQQKELDKLRSLVAKGKLEKAQAYCDKVTDGLSDKKSERFHTIMARAYFTKKMYEKAANQALISNDKKLAKKLADEFINKDKDKIKAAELYVKAEIFDKAASLFFENKKYKKAAEYSNNSDNNIKYGNNLFDKGKIEESIYFFKKAKKKGEKFNVKKVLDYLYNKKEYKDAYQIQNYKEGSFKMEIQGSIFDKMIENKENTDFIKKFMESIHIYNNKQNEIIVAAYANNKMFDELENYCMNLDELNKKIVLTFIANNEKEKNPEISAWANSLLGKNLLCNDLLSIYLINEAKKYNNKPIDNKLIDDFIAKTKSKVEKCDKEYCEILKYSANVSYNKSKESKKDNSNKAEECEKTHSFLKAVELKCKKK